MGEFSGIDPSALKRMITSFDKDRKHLRDRASYYKGQFAAHGLDTQELGQLVGICDWSDGEAPKLKRRENLAAAMDTAKGPGQHMVRVPEPISQTSAQAQADGKKLAERFNANNGGDGKAGDQYHAMAQELLAHQDDPDFCSAFYANLTPAAATLMPTLLASTGSGTAGNDLMVFSHALGTATKAGYPAPGFDKVVKSFTTPLPEGDNTGAWDRAAMLRYGDFPTGFLAKTVKVSGLDQFGKDPRQDFRGPAFTARALGLPQDIVTLDLQALSTDEKATRQVLASMGQEPGRTDLAGNLNSLASYAAGAHDPELTAAFQATLNAGAGNRSTPGPYGSYDAPILHTGAESAFATAAMSALSGSHVKYEDYQDFITTTFTTFGAPPGATGRQTGTQAATLLRLAENADPKWPATRPAIASAAAQAEKGRNDTGFMKGFYGNGGADLEAAVALELHAMDGTHDNTVLSAGSTKILAQFGDNLAAATNLHAAGKLPEFDAKTFTKPEDMWSASMLVKYGPSGDKWDAAFLTDMADATLHWGDEHQVMPAFEAASPNGAWSNWMLDPKDAWYEELGLKNDYPKHTFEEEMGITQAIADNDPRLALLSKLADNQTASRDLLSGSDGKFVAGQLISEQWQLPLGYGDNSAFPAKVVLLATERGTGGKAADEKATQAAAYVFQAAADDYKPGRNMVKEGTQALPPTLAVALADVAGAYVPDFANSQVHIGESGFSVDHDADGRPQINTDPAALNLLMHDFMSDNTEAAGAFRAAVHANMTVESARYHDDSGAAGASTVLTNLGRLDGSIDNVMNDLKYQPAAKADAQAQTEAMLTWIVGGLASPLISGEGFAVTAVAMANGGGSAWLSYQFSGTHAAAVVDAAQKADFLEEQALQLPAVNGLIHAGTIKPPPYPWYHDGNFDMTKIDPEEYNKWFDQLPKSQRYTANQLSDYAKKGHSQATAERTGNSDNVNPGN